MSVALALPTHTPDECGFARRGKMNGKFNLIVPNVLEIHYRRYASLQNIVKARKKPLAKMKLTDLGLSPLKRLESIKLAEPEPRKRGIKVDNVDGFLAELKRLGAI